MFYWLILANSAVAKTQLLFSWYIGSLSAQENSQIKLTYFDDRDKEKCS